MTRHQISSLSWLTFAVFIVIESSRLPIGSWRDLGPGFLPLGTGILLGILSIFNYYQSRSGQAPAPKESWYSPQRWPKLVIVSGSLFLYLLLWPVLGFLLSTVALLFFLFRTVEPQTWKVTIGGSVLIPVAFYGIFEMWLKTQLPKGFWGF
jgi:hypothetical protein